MKPMTRKLKMTKTKWDNEVMYWDIFAVGHNLMKKRHDNLMAQVRNLNKKNYTMSLNTLSLAIELFRKECGWKDFPETEELPVEIAMRNKMLEIHNRLFNNDQPTSNVA